LVAGAQRRLAAVAVRPEREAVGEQRSGAGVDDVARRSLGGEDGRSAGRPAEGEEAAE
jgi:hypothetical protein